MSTNRSPQGKTGGGYGRDAGGNQRPAHSSTPPPARQSPAHGRIAGDVWQKTVRTSAHMLKVPKAWAVDVVDLAAAERAGARLVDLHDMERLRHYVATVDTLRRYAFPLDRGAGKQLALVVERWSPSRGEAEGLAPRTENGAVQLTFFETGGRP